jgi:hypothetical protein
MLYFEAPAETWVLSDIPSVFLAGGITDCSDWQAEIVAKLGDLDVALLNPRRANFPIHDPSAALEQINWEFYALKGADIVSFWFDAGPSVQPIALYKLGFHAANLNKKLIVGRDPGYLRALDVDIQLGLVRPTLPIHDSLDALCDDIRRAVADW